MTEDNWKRERMSALLSILSLLLLSLEGCHGQDGSNSGGANFFYYYSPTQRTMVNHGAGLPSGNLFSSPYLNQQHVQPTLAPFAPQHHQQPTHPSLQFSSPATPLLGYQQTPPSIYSTSHPSGHFYQQPTPTGFPNFNRFGQNFFGNQHPFAQQPYVPQQQPHPQQPGHGLSFFESPFQFIQQRYLQTPPTQSVPAPTPNQHFPPTTAAPVLEAITTGPRQGPRRKQKISSRFRYVQQPLLPYQFNPYSSALPFTEQRYYSTVVPSAPTPTGYAFSLGDGTGSTSSVHVSMGPLANNVQQQHLTEITQLRRFVQDSRKPMIYLDQIATEQMNDANKQGDDPIVAGSMMEAQPSQETPVMEVTSEMASPAADPMMPHMNMTTDKLLNEPSLQTETVAVPAAQAVSDTPPTTNDEASAKNNGTNVPRRIAIRKKIARKRLRLEGAELEVNQGRSVDGVASVPVLRRNGMRRLSQNRLSADEPKKQYEGAQKGEVEESSPVPVSTSSQAPVPDMPVEKEAMENPKDEQEQPIAQEKEAMPIHDEAEEIMMPSQETPQAPANEQMQIEPIEEASPSSTTTTTTTAPFMTTMMTTTTTAAPEVSSESSPSLDASKIDEDYYYDEYDTPPGHQPNAIHQNEPAPALISNSHSQPNASDELPVLNDVRKDDYPGVFRPPGEPDNSVETDKGEVIERIKSSQPAEEKELAPSSSTTTTTKAIPALPFENQDPPEEQSPPPSDEIEEPVFKPLSTTEQPPVLVLTTTPSPSQPVDESFENAPEMEDEPRNEKPSSTESPVEDDQEQIVATMPSSTEPSYQPEPMKDDQVDSHESYVPEISSSTTEEMPMQIEEKSEMVSSTEPSSSSTESPAEDDKNEEQEQVVSSSTTIMPLPSPATTEAATEAEGEEDFPVSAENLNETESAEGEKEESNEPIVKAQRIALAETLKRLRERQQQTTESDGDQAEGENASGEGDTQTRKRNRNFVRKPVQVASLPLPTTAPMPATNAVLDDGEGEHQSRFQVIEKIQRFRQTYRRPTTTKRPRRVTRPSSTERLAIADLDSFSDSSSSTAGPVEYESSTNPSSSYSITTTKAASPLTSTTEAVTTMEPTTTTTMTPTELLTTTNSVHMTMTSTTPSTTTMTDFIENDDVKVDEDDHVYYDEVRHDDSSSTASTKNENEMYTTSSTTERGPFVTTTEEEHIEPEMSTESTTFTSASTDIPIATTTSAGQLIIHEILPTMPPLKEVSFVIGESVEDDQVILSQEEKAKHAAVRVETKVSSSIGGDDDQQGQESSSVQLSSEEASNESSPSSSTPQPSVSSIETNENGRRVRVIIRQRQRQRTQTGNRDNRRRRRKVIHKQLRRQFT